MNLWTDAWLPVRTREGQDIVVSISGLFDPDDPPLDILFTRADFRFGAMEMLAGSLTLLLQLRSAREFRKVQTKLPTLAEMQALIAKSSLTPTFNVDGEGARFLQEFKPDLSGWKRLTPLSLIMD